MKKLIDSDDTVALEHVAVFHHQLHAAHRFFFFSRSLSAVILKLGTSQNLLTRSKLQALLSWLFLSVANPKLFCQHS